MDAEMSKQVMNRLAAFLPASAVLSDRACFRATEQAESCFFSFLLHYLVWFFWAHLCPSLAFSIPL